MRIVSRLLMTLLVCSPFLVAQDVCLTHDKSYRTTSFDQSDFLANDTGIVVGEDLTLDTAELDVEQLILGLEQPFYVDYLSEGAGASHLFGFFFLDIDTDKDGIPDFFETTPTSDLDGDGLVNEEDEDDDGDGIPDVEDVAPDGVTSMPASFFREGDTAAANSISGLAGTPDYWQFVPNSVIEEGTYAGYYEHPGTYLYIDNDGDEIPDALEYTRGRHKTPPYVTDKGYSTEHINGSDGMPTDVYGNVLGLLGNDWTYQGTPGDTTADKYHWTGSTIYYIADDDWGAGQTGDYSRSPYWSDTNSYYRDVFSNLDAAPDYLIYQTDDPEDSRIPSFLTEENEDGEREFTVDARGQEHYKYRWYQSSVSGAREMCFFLVVFWNSGGSRVNTYYSKSSLNQDNAPSSPGRNGATNGDQFGWAGDTLETWRASNWFPHYRNRDDHDALAQMVWGVDDWEDIANRPSDTEQPVLNTGSDLKNPEVTQEWLDTWSNYTSSNRILQYRALADWFSSTAVDANDVINGRYTIDMSAEGDSSIIRAKDGRMVHMMVGAPRATQDAWLLGWEDLFNGGDRDYEDVVFYVKRRAGGELASLNVADDIGIGSDEDAEYSISQVTFSFEDNFLDEYWGTEGRHIAYFYRLAQNDDWIPLLGDNEPDNNHHLRTVDKFQPAYGGSTTVLDDGVTVRRTVTLEVQDKKQELYWKTQMSSENVDAAFQPKITAANVGYQSLVHDFYYNSAVIPNSNINYIASHETPLYSWSEQRNRGHLYALQTFKHGSPPVLTEVPDDASPELTPSTQPVAMWAEDDDDDDPVNLYKWDAGVSILNQVEDESEERTIYTYVPQNNAVYEANLEDTRVKLERSDDVELSEELINAFEFTDEKTTANVWVDNYHQPSAETRDETSAARWLINWIHGVEDAVIGADGEVISAAQTREWALGGINRASPLLIRAPGRPSWLDTGSDIKVSLKRSYLIFAEEQEEMGTRLIIGTDSGLVHCIDAGNWVGRVKTETVVEDGVETVVEYDWAEGHYEGDNYGTGQEMWAMLPGHLLPDVKYNYTGINEVIAKSDATAVSTVVLDSNESWRRVVIFTQGYRGGTQSAGGNDRVGNVVWAIDLTDVDDPKPLWQRSDAATQDIINPVAMGWMEFSNTEKWVVVYPSGGTPVTGQRPSFSIVDAVTGELLANVEIGEDSAAGDTMLGTPALIDTDGNGFVDHLFGATSSGNLFAYDTKGNSTVVENVEDREFYIAPNIDLDVDGNIRFVAVSGDNPLTYDQPSGTFNNNIYYYTYNIDAETWNLNGTITLKDNHKVFSRPKLIGEQLIVGTTTGDTFNFCDADPDDPGSLILYDLAYIGSDEVLEYEIADFGSVLAPIIVSDGRVLAHKSTSNQADPNSQGSVHSIRQMPKPKAVVDVEISDVFGIASWQDDLMQTLRNKALSSEDSQSESAN